MQNSKLIKVLKTFTKDEWKEYEKLVASPFFNKGRNLMPFVKALKKFYPEFNNLKLTKELIYSEVYKGKSYNDNTMKSAISSLLMLAEELLTQLSINNDSFRKKTFTLNEIIRRNSDILYNKTINEASNEAKNDINKAIKIIDIKHRYYLHKKMIKEYGNEIFQLSSLKTVAFLNELIQDNLILNAISGEYNLRKNDLLSSILLENIDLGKFVEEIKEKEFDFKDEFLLNYYLYLCEFYPAVTENYLRCKELYIKIVDRIDYEKKLNYFRFLESHLINIKRENASAEDWANEELHSLGKLILGRNIYSFSEGKYFETDTFTNLFFQSLRQKDFGFAEEMLKTHIKKILPDHAKNIKTFCLAWYWFSKKEFERALEHISKVRYLEKDLVALRYKMSLRELKIMAYYELKYFENLSNEIDAYKHFLANSSEISERFRNNKLPFIKALDKILNLTSKKDSEGLKMFYNKLNNSKPYNRHEWIKEKLEESVKQ